MSRGRPPDLDDDAIARALLPGVLKLVRAIVVWTLEDLRASETVCPLCHGRTITPGPVEDPDRILSTREVLKRIPVSRPTLWRMAREGQFPAPVQVTASRIGWRASAVLAWIAARERDPVAARRYDFGKGRNTAGGPTVERPADGKTGSPTRSGSRSRGPR